MTRGAREPAAVVASFLAAYNACDFTALAELLHDDVHVVHRGTSFDVRGRHEVLERFAENAAGMLAERRFLPADRVLTAGEHVIVEHVWQSPPREDLSGGSTGERVTTELCTIFTVRDGVLVEYVEYG